MPVSGKRVIKKLQRNGWMIKSQRGSHVKLIKGSRLVIVPLHGDKELGLGLLREIEKQTGVKLK